MKKLGFGCMRFPMHGETIDVEEVEKMVDTFMERDFTYFDTSYVYHNLHLEFYYLHFPSNMLYIHYQLHKILISLNPSLL